MLAAFCLVVLLIFCGLILGLIENLAVASS